MKKFFTVALILLALVSHSQAVNAQDNQSNPGLIISPATNIIYESDFGSEYVITIENKTDAKLRVTPTEKYVQKQPTGEVTPIELEDQNYLDFPRKAFTLQPNSKKLIRVRVRLIYDEVKAYPAVAFTTKSTSEDVAAQTELLSVFVLQNVEGTLNINTDVAAAKGVVFDPNVQLAGTITNSGEKFFNPSGSISIFKDDQLVYEKQITSQIEGLTFPNQTKDFELKWLNESNALSAMGNYRIEVRVKPSPYAQVYGTKINFFYIPLQLVAIVLIAVSVIALLFMLSQKILKTKKK